MTIKYRSVLLKLSLALGVLGVAVETLPAQAQAGNLSDVTGAIITTSDIAGGFAPGGGNQTILVFRSDEIETNINRAALRVNQQLASNDLPVIATNEAPTAIPAAVQQNLAAVVASTGNGDAGTTQIASALIEAGANPSLAQTLASSLSGLTAGGTVEAAQLQAAIEAYNALINFQANNASTNLTSFEFLNTPPEELRAIQSLLSILLGAAF